MMKKEQPDMYDNQTLGELLSDPRIRLIAPDAIRDWDLRNEEMWNKTLAELREEHFGGGLDRGFSRLFAAAETGEWYYPLYTEAECAEDAFRRGVNVVRLPSDDPEAANRPFILLVPGGGFVNVWNLTEGWPVAAQFNSLGYHVFILTYQVGETERLMEKNMGDFVRALRFIQENEERFHIRGGEYITCGFSAGGYLVCLWNTLQKGYAAFGLPKPRATFPVYPVVSLKHCAYEPDDAIGLYGCSIEEAAKTAYEIPEHAEGFPPCAVFVAAGDELVNPDHSRMLAAALEKLSIPCRLEIGSEGGHGFADGTGMCMAGWTERAVRWYESLQP
jgi:acetyl esterase/lipase